jgi:hypothetical protein
MTREYLELGPVPCDEKCEQVGPDCDYGRMSAESREYANQLYRMFPGAEDANCSFGVKSFPHDFGSYKEVVVRFDSDDEKSVEFAFNVENNLPAEWDEQARVALGL